MLWVFVIDKNRMPWVMSTSPEQVCSSKTDCKLRIGSSREKWTSKLQQVDGKRQFPRSHWTGWKRRNPSYLWTFNNSKRCRKSQQNIFLYLTRILLIMISCFWIQLLYCRLFSWRLIIKSLNHQLLRNRK